MVQTSVTVKFLIAAESDREANSLSSFAIGSGSDSSRVSIDASRSFCFRSAFLLELGSTPAE